MIIVSNKFPTSLQTAPKFSRNSLIIFHNLFRASGPQGLRPFGPSVHRLRRRSLRELPCRRCLALRVSLRPPARKLLPPSLAVGACAPKRLIARREQAPLKAFPSYQTTALRFAHAAHAAARQGLDGSAARVDFTMAGAPLRVGPWPSLPFAAPTGAIARYGWRASPPVSIVAPSVRPSLKHIAKSKKGWAST